MPLGVVAVQQRCSGVTAHHGSQLPGQVVGVLYTRIAAACAKRADHMRRVTRKKHPSVAQRVNTFTAVSVRAYPDNLALVGRQSTAKLGIQSLPHHVFAADQFGVGVWCHLVVNAPDAVGHQVLPDRAAFVKGCFYPGVAFHRRRVFKAYIGNAPAVIAFFGGDRGCYPSAKRAARSGAVHHMLGLQCVST